MPAIAIAAVAGFAASSVAGFVGAAVGSALVGHVVGAVAGGVVSSILGRAVGLDRPRGGGAALAGPAARSILVTGAGTVAPIPIVYGRRRLGGTLAFRHTAGERNRELYQVIVLCEGPIHAVTQAHVNDQPFTPDADVQIEYHLGGDDQPASPLLLAHVASHWSNAHRLRGIAYAVVRIIGHQERFGGSVPNFAFDVQGRTLFDPRTSTTAWSDNPALCIRDYLTHPRYGRGIPASGIDDAAIISAANHCDELVSIPGGGTQRRYTTNGIVDPSQTIFECYRDLLTACRGFPIYSAGRHRLILDRPEATTGFDLNESNVVGAWRIAPPGKRDRWNRVKARYFDAGANWTAGIAVSDGNVQRATDDAGTLLEQEIELPLTSDRFTAERIAMIERRQSRFGIVVELTATIAATRVECGDVVTITHPVPGWSAKPFRIMRIALTGEGEVRITAREYQAASYALDPHDAPRTVPATNLPAPGSVGTPGTPSITEQIYETRAGRGVAVRAIVRWAPASHPERPTYELEWRRTGDPAWRTEPTGMSPERMLDDIASGAYAFRVRTVGERGTTSAWSAEITHTILGLSAAPAAPVGVSLQAIGGQALITLARTTALDVLRGGRVLVRHSEATAGAEWDAAFQIGQPTGWPGDAVYVLVPLKAGTYLLRYENVAGMLSAVASVTTLQASVLAFSPVGSVTESPTFPGAHDGTFADPHAGFMALAGVGLFDSIASLDAIADLDAFGGVRADGTYTFAAGLDLGTVRNTRLTGSLGGLAVNVLDRLDDRTGNVDDWPDWDGVTAGTTTDAWIETRQTDTDPAGSPVWSAWARLDASERRARAFQFRARLTSREPAYNQRVTTLGVRADTL